MTIETAIAQPTFSTFMGIKIIEITPERVKAELPVREDFRNRGGVMHGGAWTTGMIDRLVHGMAAALPENLALAAVAAALPSVLLCWTRNRPPP